MFTKNLSRTQNTKVQIFTLRKQEQKEYRKIMLKTENKCFCKKKEEYEKFINLL